MHDPRRHSPAAERNRQPILDVLRRVLPPQGVALEVASGTGQHVAHFAAGLPGWTWWPSDPDPSSAASVAAWCADAGVAHVQPLLTLDVTAPTWRGVPARLDAVYCANMIHIAPWATCPALMAGAARHLRTGGVLLLYGPFLEHGVPTSPGNAAFDADLRQRDPQWGLRTLHDVQAAAHAAGLRLRQRHAMPAHNLLLVFGPAAIADAAVV